MPGRCPRKSLNSHGRPPPEAEAWDAVQGCGGYRKKHQALPHVPSAQYSTFPIASLHRYLISSTGLAVPPTLYSGKKETHRDPGIAESAPGLQPLPVQRLAVVMRMGAGFAHLEVKRDNRKQGKDS